MRAFHLVLGALAAPMVLVLGCAHQPATTADYQALAKKDLDAAIFFADRCSGCHGNRGLGEGTLPLIFGDYPRATLVLASNESEAVIRQRAVDVITDGKVSEDAKMRMPPGPVS